MTQTFIDGSDVVIRLLGQDGGNPWHQQRGEAVAQAAYAIMVKETNRHMIQTTYTKQIQKVGTPESVHLYLNEYPVTAGSISIFTDDGTTAISSNDWKLIDADISKIYKSTGWSNPTYYWKVTYEAGYTQTDNQWEGLKEIQLEIAMLLWERGGGDTEKVPQVDQFVVFDRSVDDKERAMKAWIKDVLRPYKKVVFA